MKTRELRVKFGTQQSFGKKAFVKVDDDNTEYMYSNYTLIVTNYGKAIQFESDFNLYSNTTMKHVREYLKQIGKGELAILSKSKLLKKLEETNYIVLDIL